MKKIAILFSHYNKFDITLRHYDIMKKNNTYDIIPIGFSGYDLIEGSYVVDYENKLWPKNTQFNTMPFVRKLSGWSEADVQLYDFVHNNKQYDSYITFDSDTYCNVSIDEFFGEALEMNYFGCIIKDINIDTDWCWFKYLSELQLKNLKIGGVTTLCGTYYSKNVMNDIIKLLLSDIDGVYNNMFDECRIATLVKMAGYPLQIAFPDYWKYMCSVPEVCKQHFELVHNGYFHPVQK